MFIVALKKLSVFTASLIRSRRLSVSSALLRIPCLLSFSRRFVSLMATVLCAQLAVVLLGIAELHADTNAKLANTKASSSTHAGKTLVFERCTVSQGAIEIDAECAKLRRHENPKDSNSRPFDLSVIKLPSHATEPAADAFTIIQGGPGGSSIDLAIAYSSVFDEIRRKRDILVIDQRGTGRSNLLTCEIPEDTSSQFDLERSIAYTRQCAEELSLNNDLRFYTTSIAVDDLEALRRASGYPQLSLYGVSYGTRVALHYLRKYPAQTRAMIIDGVAHLDLNLASEDMARVWQNSFDALNVRCQEDTSCKQEHGDLRSNYDDLLRRFSAEPITVNLPHPNGGQPTSYTFDEFSLIGAMRMMPYSTEQSALIPILLSEALKGNYTFAAAQIIQMEQYFSDQFAMGMYNTVMCAEDAPFAEKVNQGQAKGTILGPLLSELAQASCQVWPKGPVDADFHQPFSSDKPVLILSGETDPVTPPANGASTATMLSNSKHIVVPAHGHGVIARGCVPKLASMFIENASFDGIDETCTQRERAMPIFTTLTGPQP